MYARHHWVDIIEYLILRGFSYAHFSVHCAQFYVQKRAPVCLRSGDQNFGEGPISTLFRQAAGYSGELDKIINSRRNLQCSIQG